MVTFANECKIFEWDENPQTNKQTNKQTNRKYDNHFKPFTLLVKVKQAILKMDRDFTLVNSRLLPYTTTLKTILIKRYIRRIKSL